MNVCCGDQGTQEKSIIYPANYQVTKHNRVQLNSGLQWQPVQTKKITPTHAMAQTIKRVDFNTVDNRRQQLNLEVTQERQASIKKVVDNTQIRQINQIKDINHKNISGQRIIMDSTQGRGHLRISGQ